MTPRPSEIADNGKQRIAALVNLWEKKQQTSPEKPPQRGIGYAPLQMASPLRQVSSRHMAVESSNGSENNSSAMPQTAKHTPDSSPKAESMTASTRLASTQPSRTLDVWCRFANL
jgi:hypothetical protein